MVDIVRLLPKISLLPTSSTLCSYKSSANVLAAQEIFGSGAFAQGQYRIGFCCCRVRLHFVGKERLQNTPVSLIQLDF